MEMFLGPFPMEYTFLNSFDLQEYVLVLMTSTAETHVWLLFSLLKRLHMVIIPLKDIEIFLGMD